MKPLIQQNRAITPPPPFFSQPKNCGGGQTPKLQQFSWSHPLSQDYYSLCHKVSASATWNTCHKTPSTESPVEKDFATLFPSFIVYATSWKDMGRPLKGHFVLSIKPAWLVPQPLNVLVPRCPSRLLSTSHPPCLSLLCLVGVCVSGAADIVLLHPTVSILACRWTDRPKLVT